MHKVKLLTRIGGHFGGDAGDVVEAPTDIVRAWYTAGIIGDLPDGANPKPVQRPVVAARQTSAPAARPPSPKHGGDA